MTHSIQYTTIPDMRNRLGVNVQELSLAMSLGTVGGLFGGPMAGVVDRYCAATSAIKRVSMATIVDRSGVVL